MSSGKGNVMDNQLYEDIFKRKSFHLFRNVGTDRIDNSELDEIAHAFNGFDSLYPEIKTAIRILPASEVNFKRDAEYCILIYSEKKDNYLMNAGYIGQQLDLYLVHHNIGSLWFGIGKPDKETYEGLDYVIMIAVHKINNQSLYRKDMFKAKRKPLEKIWIGETLGIAEIARFSPSACNSQPWFVKNENGTLIVSRYKQPGKRGIMPAKAVSYFNRIDLGIFLCILELCMVHNNINFNRTLFIDDGDDREYTKSAEYRIEISKE